MEMDSKLIEELENWEPGYGLPEEESWRFGLLNNFGGELLLEGESFWKSNDDDLLLKELKSKAAAACNAASEPVHPNDNLLDDWVDEALDLETVNELMNSPEFEYLIEHFGKTPLEIIDHLVEESNSSVSEQEDECCCTLQDDSCRDLQPQVIVVENVDNNDLLLENSAVISDDVFITIDTAAAGSLQLLSPPSISLASPPEVIEETPEDKESHPTLSADRISLEDDGQSVGMTVESNVAFALPEVLRDSSCSDESRPSSPFKIKGIRKNPRRRKPYSIDDSQSSPSTSSSADDDDKPVAGEFQSSRKRGQNRTAASRYRMKKKAMNESLGKEEEELVAKNNNLKDKVNQLSNEISYLKGLMKEILIAKGLIKPNK